jgi:hypothetical protein
MNHYHSPTMSQKIFNLGLDTETVSVYLLCCGLVDAGGTLSEKSLQTVWNGTQEVLLEGLRRLKARRIIHQIIADGTPHAVYRLNADNQWRHPKAESAS